MLYRRPRFSLRNIALAIVAAHRRRRVELDLSAMSPHLRADLGLLDRELSELIDP